MSQWPKQADSDDGYELVTNAAKDGNDLIVGDTNITVEACKAACNSTSQCKSIAYRKQGGNVCFLKTWTKSDGNRPDTNYDTYYKNGEPANSSRMYITKPISPAQGWRSNGLFAETKCRSRADCGVTLSKKVGDVNEKNAGASCGGSPDWNREKEVTCTTLPRSMNMCPNLGPDSGNKDLRYFVHDAMSSQKVDNFNFDRYGDSNRFTNRGSNLSENDYKTIRCGYNRIKEDVWSRNSLEDYFDRDTAKTIVKDHCFASAVTSKELAASTNCRDQLTKYLGNLDEYNLNVISKLKNESNWWNDSTNCTNFANIVKNNTSNTPLLNTAKDVINALPNTGWSDDLVKALNQIRGTNGASILFESIDNKIVSYCDASNGSTNSKCGCRNAVKFGLGGCTNDITGCVDVKRYAGVFDEIDKYSSAFGLTLRRIYNPNYDSNACQETKNSSSTVLRYGDVNGRGIQVTGCFQQIDNEGTITADKIKQVCQITESGTSTAPPPPATTDSSSSSSETNNKLSKNLFGNDTDFKDTDIYIMICICVCIFMFMIGIGLLIVMV